MTHNRRDFLAACITLGAAGITHAVPEIAVSPPRLLPRPEGRRRVVIIGGGWGGLTAACHLREQAPELEVVLLERNAAFWSCPLSNKWLANLVDTRHLMHDYATAARAYGYTFIRTRVEAVDRDRRRVVTTDGSVDYDWLVLAVGIRYDYTAWFGDDRRAAEHARQHYPAAYAAGDDFAALKRKLDGFAGGDLVMTVPPMPYRCPPAPYERAAMIGWLLKTRRIKGKLIVLDPNPISPAFLRVFEERYRDQIDYRQDMRVQSVDPFNRKIATEFDEIRFDDAILIPPQQAGDLVWQTSLTGQDSTGKPTGWADVEPLRLHARDDERIFLIGDAVGPVSPLFGHYPKSGHMASRQGRIVAREIAARARDAELPVLLPESVCYLFTDFDPMTMVRIDAGYRVRGDGLIEQKVRQVRDPNPRGEDLAWATELFGEFLAFKS